MTITEFKDLFNILKALPAVQSFRNEQEKQSYKIVRYKEEDYLIPILEKNSTNYQEDLICIGYYSNKKNWNLCHISFNEKESFIIHSEQHAAYMVKFESFVVSTTPYVHGLQVNKKELEARANKKALKLKIAKL